MASRKFRTPSSASEIGSVIVVGLPAIVMVAVSLTMKNLLEKVDAFPES